MDDILNTDAARKAIKELTIAFIATVVTLIIAALLFIIVPRVQAEFKSVDVGLKHTRVYKLLPDGGLIEYSPTGKGSVEMERLKKDLEILSRRFAGGQFEITLLAGFKDSPLARDLKKKAGLYSYSVTVEGDKAILRIKSADRKAVRSLHEYLKYLEERWIFQ